MSSSWTDEIKTLEARMAQIPLDLVEGMKPVLEKHLSKGADRMSRIIETSDTPYGLSQGRSGRVDTGQMLGDVSSRVSTETTRTLSGRYGWQETAQQHPYYLYQEQGFKHSGTGRDVAPMHALLQSFIETREEFYGELVDMLRARLK